MTDMQPPPKKPPVSIDAKSVKRRRDGFLLIVVPKDCRAGDHLLVPTANGVRDVEIPKGKKAGSKFLVDPDTGITLDDANEFPKWVADTLVWCSIQ